MNNFIPHVKDSLKKKIKITTTGALVLFPVLATWDFVNKYPKYCYMNLQKASSLRFEEGSLKND